MSGSPAVILELACNALVLPMSKRTETAAAAASSSLDLICSLYDNSYNDTTRVPLNLAVVCAECLPSARWTLAEAAVVQVCKDGKPLELFDMPCRQMLCALCMLEHNGHRILPFSEAVAGSDGVPCRFGQVMATHLQQDAKLRIKILSWISASLEECRRTRLFVPVTLRTLRALRYS